MGDNCLDILHKIFSKSAGIVVLKYNQYKNKTNELKIRGNR